MYTVDNRDAGCSCNDKNGKMFFESFTDAKNLLFKAIEDDIKYCLNSDYCVTDCSTGEVVLSVEQNNARFFSRESLEARIADLSPFVYDNHLIRDYIEWLKKILETK